ncbi:hypothetical protein [Pseudovibrio brasiliensis]|uniref:Uncharacterized protein n=1 Tax=Pseudovibrio brasiliensis TaxID=1898042 RepID=A0ABX8AH11_9HYPH|nr:hypothetical protein [Pseudovibrio brasiliensis]QUS54365.1 hypothetical protein KGB56_13260 [Pseudovibrio brasiliensis]
MTEILFSQNDRYTNVIARLEAAISGKSVPDARVSLTKSASKNGEVLYKATVSQDNKDGLSEKVLGLCRAVTRHTRFLQNKAERPEQKVSNWNVFYQLLRNEAAQSLYEHAREQRQDRFEEAISYISQFVYEEEKSDPRGLKFSSLRNLSSYLKSQSSAVSLPPSIKEEPKATVGVSSALLMSSLGFQLAGDQMRYVSDDNFRFTYAGVGKRDLDDYLDTRPSLDDTVQPTDDHGHGDEVHPMDGSQPEMPHEEQPTYEAVFNSMNEAAASELSLQQSRDLLDEKGEVETGGPDEDEAVRDKAYSRDKLKTKAAKITPLGEESDPASEGGMEVQVEDPFAGAEEDALERRSEEEKRAERRVKVHAFDRAYQSKNAHAVRTVSSSQTAPNQ